MKSRHKLFKYVAYTVNTVKFLVHIISKHGGKAIPLMFETEICGPFLVRKIKLGVMGPRAPTVATPLFKDFDWKFHLVTFRTAIARTPPAAASGDLKLSFWQFYLLRLLILWFHFANPSLRSAGYYIETELQMNLMVSL